MGAKRLSSNTIQILWRASQIYNYSLKLTLFLKEGKRSGKRLKKGKKEMKRKKYILYGLNVKIKDKLFFCILNSVQIIKKKNCQIINKTLKQTQFTSQWNVE